MKFSIAEKTPRFLAVVVICFGFSSWCSAQQKSPHLQKLEQSLKSTIPNVMCVDSRFTTAGQPTDEAYRKLAQNGYRSVLNLRTTSEGVDLKREQELVEKAGMRYINIPVVPASPKPEQVTEFFNAIQNRANQPMLIHCATANRVGAFWVIYRVLKQGWSEDKAMEEATKIGLTKPDLKKFALDYIANYKQRKSGKR